MAKKLRKTVNLEVRLDFIRRMGSGDHADLGLPPTTESTIYENAEQIRESAKRAITLTTKLMRSKGALGWKRWNSPCGC